VGARPLLVTGTAATTAGMYWFSRIDVHTSYVSGLLGPSLVTATGLGVMFVPLALVALIHLRDQDSGLASGLFNTGQQLGGAIGLAALGTVAWTAVADSARLAASAATGGPGHALAADPGSPLPAPIDHSALATGITRGFLAAAGIAVAALVVTVVTIRVRREDLADATAAADGPPVSAAPVGQGAQRVSASPDHAS